MKCYEFIDKITSSLATREVSVSLSLNDDSVIDAKELHKLQTSYLHLMAGVRNVDRKKKTEKNFQKTIQNRIKNLKNVMNKNSWF